MKTKQNNSYDKGKRTKSTCGKSKVTNISLFAFSNPAVKVNTDESEAGGTRTDALFRLDFADERKGIT